MKKKVVAGVVTVGMVASMGTAFAATGAGVQVQNWYTTASGVVKSIVSGNFATYYASENDIHNNKVNSSIGQARQDIRDAGNAEKSRATDAVNAEVDAYIAQIQGAQAKIEASMPREYDAYVSVTNKETNTEVNKTGAANETALNSAIKNHQGVYIGRLNEGVAATQDAAVNELNEQIQATKDALSALLASEGENAQGEIEENLRNKLDALQAKLAKVQTAGVNNAKKAITDRGAELEQAAKAELDSIVQGIAMDPK
ncbi:hypothetical protein [Paenibacillus lemnae]|nr:hypothetical protein [Paenibacillus lemnae]